MGGSTPAATEQPTSAEPASAEPSLALLPEVPVAANSLALMDEQGRVINNTEGGRAPGRRRRGRGLPVGGEHDGRRGDPDRRRDLLVHGRDSGRRRPDVRSRRGSEPSGSPTAATAPFRGSMPRRVTWYRSSRWAWRPSGIATDDRWVWVTNMLDGTLSRIDPVTEAVDTFPVGRAPLGVTSAVGDVWVADYEAGEVVRVDPSTGDVVDRIPVGNGPTSIATDGDHALGRRHGRRHPRPRRSGVARGQGEVRTRW